MYFKPGADIILLSFLPRPSSYYQTLHCFVTYHLKNLAINHLEQFLNCEHPTTYNFQARILQLIPRKFFLVTIPKHLRLSICWLPADYLRCRTAARIFRAAEWVEWHMFMHHSHNHPLSHWQVMEKFTGWIIKFKAAAPNFRQFVSLALHSAGNITDSVLCHHGGILDSL